MQHQELCEQVEKCVKKTSTAGIDFAKEVSSNITHHARTTSSTFTSFSQIDVRLPSVEGTVKLGELMEELKTLGKVNWLHLFRDPKKTTIEIHGQIDDRTYFLHLISDDR